LIKRAIDGVLKESVLAIPKHSENVRQPLFIVRNLDPNQTHSVEIQIVNLSGTNLCGRIYSLDPGNSMLADIPAPDYNLDVFFNVLIDGHYESEMLVNMSPTHVAVIEIGSPDDPYLVSFSVIDVTPKRI
ncbi:hypothetical protein, partial [Methanoregula sp.]|uniref:hypothetical protein n=1 Tax=Methanoregula sp. TaxID=2052170 RepID=UPI000CC64B76